MRSSLLLSTLAGCCAAALSLSAQAFCGFYVGKADTTLFNEASQVIVARDGERTVISMQNDYRGDLREFALVVPVPTVLRKGQVNIGDKRIFDRLDAYSAPRLTEYNDENPCDRRRYERDKRSDMVPAPMAAAPAARASRSLGVTIEASYSVGEYDIVILSAKESDGLETWLTQNGYRLPRGAARALAPYIRQNMKFFVAKVNLREQAATGVQTLRPLQFAFESEKFMLPLRLGMINARGPQDLIVYMLTRHGRVETTNYRTVKLPADMDLPTYIRSDFGGFYKAMFKNQAQKDGNRAVYTEYFWDMSWCDPCAANPLSPEELRQAGVFWQGGQDSSNNSFAPPQRSVPMPPQGSQAMLTRLHVRYTPDTFPEDLAFQETADRTNFQARYVLRNPWNGSVNDCPEAQGYFQQLHVRQEKEARQLATLTGWELGSIRNRMDLRGGNFTPSGGSDGGGNGWWPWRQN
ncbi:MAG: hypothetical protein JWN73_2501 [Betaproteobacteria bacterium]|nr:hypothetical protein [Betaproteobacteria bacterium]